MTATYRFGEKPKVGDLIYCADIDGTQMYNTRLNKFAIVKYLYKYNIDVLWCYDDGYNKEIMYGISIFKCFDLVKRNGKEWLNWI